MGLPSLVLKWKIMVISFNFFLQNDRTPSTKKKYLDYLRKLDQGPILGGIMVYLFQIMKRFVKTSQLLPFFSLLKNWKFVPEEDSRKTMKMCVGLV